MANKLVLFVKGVADSGQAIIDRDKSGAITIVGAGACNVSSSLSEMLQNDGINSREMLLVPKDVKRNIQLPRPDLIFNEISESDTHGVTLGIAAMLADKLECPVMNSPDLLHRAGRESLAALLAETENVRVPFTKRMRGVCTPTELVEMVGQYFADVSVIVRKAGDHGGVSTILLALGAVNDSLHAIPYGRTDILVSQFVDYRSTDGLYRKYRFALVGGRPIARHMIVSDQWMIHSRSREYMDTHDEFYREEQAFLEQFNAGAHDSLSQILHQIAKASCLDYCGLDCHVSENGEVLVFELNPNMNMLLNHDRSGCNVWEPQIMRIRTALCELIQHRLRVKPA